MPVPRLDGYFNDGEQHAEGSQKSLGALPVLLVALHAVFEFGDASAVSVAHEAGHLRLQHSSGR